MMRVFDRYRTYYNAVASNETTSTVCRLEQNKSGCSPARRGNNSQTARKLSTFVSFETIIIVTTRILVALPSQSVVQCATKSVVQNAVYHRLCIPSLYGDIRS